jgi:hypothetical protein
MLSFTYRGVRYCITCTKLKAEARRYDARTYTGNCPKGHPYTRDNTLIVSTQNSKVCLRCKRVASARARAVPADLIPQILAQARLGATINAVLGRGPTKGYKVLAGNSVTIRRLTNLKTPEGRELKQLFAQNEKMAHAKRFGVNSWLPDRREFLATQLTRSTNLAGDRLTASATSMPTSRSGVLSSVVRHRSSSSLRPDYGCRREA